MTEPNLADVVAEDRRINPAERLVNVYKGRLPADIKQVFHVARALVVGNDIVQPVISKMAEAPVTRLIVKGEGNEETTTKGEEKLLKIFNDILKIKSHLLGLSYDNYGYSNAFSSVYFAPKRYLKCPNCEDRAKNEKDKRKRKLIKQRWLATNMEWKPKIGTEKTNNISSYTIDFIGKCPGCKKNGVQFIREDVTYHNTNSLRLIRWDPFYMDIDHYRELGRNEYYYRFPKKTIEKMRKGERIMLSEYPWSIIQAAINNRTLHINQKGFYHFKLESISGVYEGWGVPRILSVLTALYTVLSMVKANEATAEGRINDLTIISPMQRGRGGTTEDPIQTMGLSNWLNQTKAAIQKFKKDRTLTAFLPFPVQSESIYGHGRQQLISSELQIYIRNILAALGLPEDVIYSGGNYTSIAVAARLLANQADDMRKQYNQFLTFVKDTISKSLTDSNFSDLNVSLEPYESADDFQKTNMQIQMAMVNKFPWTQIYKKFNMTFDEVITTMTKEAKEFGKVNKEIAESEGRSLASMASIQDYLKMSMAKQMMRFNELDQMATAAKSNEDPAKKPLLAQQMAEQIAQQYPPDMWEDIVLNMAGTDTEFAKMVSDALKEIQIEMQRHITGPITEGSSAGDGGEDLNIGGGNFGFPGGQSPGAAMNTIASKTQETDKKPSSSLSKL
jgi:hypothetical protein